MDSITTKSRENRARRQLGRKGYRLEKTPARSWQRDHFPPGYMILMGNHVVEGCSSRQWEATLDQVEHYAASATAHI